MALFVVMMQLLEPVFEPVVEPVLEPVLEPVVEPVRKPVRKPVQFHCMQAPRAHKVYAFAPFQCICETLKDFDPNFSACTLCPHETLAYEAGFSRSGPVCCRGLACRAAISHQH